MLRLEEMDKHSRGAAWEDLPAANPSGRQPVQKQKLLLHVCCAPCSSATLERLTPWFDVDVLFYNPNIFPQEEYDQRAQEEARFLRQRYGADGDGECCDKDTSPAPLSHIPRLIIPPFDPSPFQAIARGREALPEKGERCYLCYELRIEETAKMAKEGGYDCFTTSLSISPYKVARWINEIGLRMEEKWGVPFLYSDFKKKDGYRRSLELSRQYDLYRQDYCGCEYSKKERESKKGYPHD